MLDKNWLNCAALLWFEKMIINIYRDCKEIVPGISGADFIHFGIKMMVERFQR